MNLIEEIVDSVIVGHTFKSADDIRLALSEALTRQADYFRGEVEKMKEEKWISHGRDCEEGRRPCGVADINAERAYSTDRLADACRIETYDDETLDAVLRVFAPITKQ